MRRFKEAYRTMPGTIAILLIAIVMFVVEQFVPLENGAERAIVCGAYYKPFILAGEWWRLVTCMFLHGGILHILMNMFTLYDTGMVLEKNIGTWRFLVVLIGSVIGGSLFEVISSGSTVSVGMSGGLYGVMACLIVVLVRSGMIANSVIKKYLVKVILVNLAVNFMPNIAWEAHLGGFITGLFLSATLLKDHDKAMTKTWRFATIVYMIGMCALAGVNWNLSEQNVYLASDLNVLKVYDKVGLHHYSRHMAEKLDEIYDAKYLEFALELEENDG